MNRKWPLYVGIVLLVTGILLRIFSDIGHHIPVLVIISGASFKIYYVIAKIRSGEYKPGFEVVLLYLGLIMFFTGVFMRNHHTKFNHVYLMAPGIALKLLFIFTFIKKVRKKTVS